MLQYNAIPEKHFLNQHWISFVVSEECEHGEVGVSQSHSLILRKHCRQCICQGQNNWGKKNMIFITFTNSQKMVKLLKFKKHMILIY